MCEHCKEVQNNRKKLPEQEPDRLLCGARRMIKTKAEECCNWRGTCCGGGCCESVSCCGGGQQKPENDNTNGYNKMEGMSGSGMGGMGMGGYGMAGMGMYGYGMGGMGGTPRRIDDETVVCNMKRDKYCSGGECYLMIKEDFEAAEMKKDDAKDDDKEKGNSRM